MKNHETSYTAEILDKHGVDYRVIGSRAVHLYNIENNKKPGDIDVLIPRQDMKIMPEVRRDLRREFGRRVILGTFPGLTTINFRPEGISQLEYRDLSVPLDELTMVESVIENIKTLQPQTLAGLYETIGGFMKESNIEYKNALLEISDQDSDPAFEEFRQERRERYPLYGPSKKVADKLSNIVPKGARLALQDGIESRIERYV